MKSTEVTENVKKKKKAPLIIIAVALIAIIGACNSNKTEVNSVPDRTVQSSQSSESSLVEVTTEEASETENMSKEETITDTDISLESFVDVAETTDVTIEETTIADTDISPESFVNVVEETIQGAVGSDEFITDVNLTDGTLTVSVDLSKADATIVSLEDLAVTRASSITDNILELKQYDEFWSEMVVDFGVVGSVSRTKDDIKDSTFGRYFEINELDSKNVVD